MNSYSRLIANYRDAKVRLGLATRERFIIGSWWLHGESKTRTQIVGYCDDPDFIGVTPSPYDWDKDKTKSVVVRVESLVPDRSVPERPKRQGLRCAPTKP